MKYEIGTTVAYIGDDAQVLGVVYKREQWRNEEYQDEDTYDVYYIEWQDDFNNFQEYTESDIDKLHHSFLSLTDEKQ